MEININKFLEFYLYKIIILILYKLNIFIKRLNIYFLNKVNFHFYIYYKSNLIYFKIIKKQLNNTFKCQNPEQKQNRLLCLVKIQPLKSN